MFFSNPYHHLLSVRWFHCLEFAYHFLLDSNTFHTCPHSSSDSSDIGTQTLTTSLNHNFGDFVIPDIHFQASEIPIAVRQDRFKNFCVIRLSFSLNCHLLLLLHLSNIASYSHTWWCVRWCRPMEYGYSYTYPSACLIKEQLWRIYYALSFWASIYWPSVHHGQCVKGSVRSLSIKCVRPFPKGSDRLTASPTWTKLSASFSSIFYFSFTFLGSLSYLLWWLSWQAFPSSSHTIVSTQSNGRRYFFSSWFTIYPCKRKIYRLFGCSMTMA